MWEMPGVPVEAFSGRSQAIREAVGEDASLKSRDVAALDTRKSKQHVDPEVRMAACRYDTEGYVTEHISQEEEAYAAARLDKIRRQNRIKAELQAVLDEK